MSGEEVASALYPKRHKFTGEVPRLDPYEASLSTEKLLEVEKEAEAGQKAWAEIVAQSHPRPGWRVQ